MRLHRRYLVFVMLLVAPDCLAQFNNFRFEAGISAGTLIYQGDLTPKYYGHTKELRPALAVQLTRTFGSVWSLRSALLLSKIMADESKYSDPEFRQKRNYRFSASVAELSAALVYSPLGQQQHRQVFPYIFAGAGITHLNIKRDWSRYQSEYFDKDGIAARSLATDTVHALPQWLPVIPAGIGIRYQLTTAVALTTEVNLRFSYTDYMDGFRYQDTDRRDRYYGMSVGFVYRFIKNPYRCPSGM